MSKHEKATSYKPNATIEILTKMVKANDQIMAKGGLPIAVSLIGPHGIGKSTVCKEVASSLGRGFFKLNLAQLTEPSELQGFYLKEFMVKKDNKEVWVTENMLPKFMDDGFEHNNDVRTRSCPPDWVLNLEKDSILCLDDFSRGNSLLSQAVMELVNTNEMIGWDLKGKNVQIILNENPDNGEYNVSSNDAAQADRMAKINMTWDAGDWAERAEKMSLDERLINFVLWMPELLEDKKADGISASGNISPRMMDKFFSLVSTIDDFEKNLDTISLYGDITVGKVLTSNLLNFIAKRLDKLPSVHKLIKEYELPTAKSQLTAACGDQENDSANWKSGTAGILTTRLYNYVIANQKDMDKKDIKQYSELMLHNSFSVDQKFLLVRQVIGCGNRFSAILTGDPRFIKYMTT